VPKDIQWLAANVDGRVDRIAVEAGAGVRRGDVIATLANPRLRQQLQAADWELQAQAKENRAAEMTLQSQLADLRADAANAVLDYRSAKLKVDAEQKLVENGIVPRVTFEQSKLVVEQDRQRIESQRERVAKMQASLQATMEAHAARLEQMRNSRDLIGQQIDDLAVRAPIDGVVQEMALKLGQQVAPGVEAAKIAPHGNLVAQLDIQAFQARDIALGQAVAVDTGSSTVAGTVTRIDPAVTNGVVKVEVGLRGPMPAEARPDLSVTGVIDIERKPDALYVERPAAAQSYAKTTLYRLDADGDAATRVNVEFGRASTRSIEVLGGLKQGDRVIVSDPSAWESHANILIR
jgi:multidrug resistance efflux pump